ncbi:MAG: D-glycero-D-manno-heptose 1-phosphate guanosyltransferase [Candidatus Saganbacteria bacterium]|uniref:D-glycero-D-manno-heptose 1-phosphate guanosyltransferase n=1 Tax=Candidatus Saganbacteria bacterium TaxID=2575572 RepID=A0A833L2M1_UNCSA|nr:MAG: D-glycero-D-manno-heptose 1-phosphate guanosyltransferase [Candidatus Saganbacteria bacterium]
MKQAVILAGGAGTRLKPLTDNIPKPMIDINGKPFILYIIEYLKKSGIKNVVLCTGYLADKISDYFGNGKKYGVDIRYSVEKKFLGTAGAIKLADNLLEDEFFVLNGDTYLPIDYTDVLRKFKEKNKTGLMVAYDHSEWTAEENTAIDQDEMVIAYGKREPLKIGNQLIESRSEIEVISPACFKYIDAGVYVFKKEILGIIEKDKFVSLEGDVYPELIKKKQLCAYISSQRYYDLGTPERLEIIKKVLK